MTRERIEIIVDVAKSIIWTAVIALTVWCVC